MLMLSKCFAMLVADIWKLWILGIWQKFPIDGLALIFICNQCYYSVVLIKKIRERKNIYIKKKMKFDRNLIG